MLTIENNLMYKVVRNANNFRNYSDFSGIQHLCIIFGFTLIIQVYIFNFYCELTRNNIKQQYKLRLMRKNYNPNFLTILASLLTLLIPLCSNEMIYFGSQVSTQRQLKSGLSTQPSLRPTLTVLTQFDKSISTLSRRQSLKNQLLRADQDGMSVNSKSQKQMLPNTGNSAVKQLEMQKDKVLGIVVKPIKNIGFWSTQTLQNVATANLFEKIMTNISSRQQNSTNITTFSSFSSSSKTTTMTTSTGTTFTSQNSSNSSSSFVNNPPPLVLTQLENSTFQLDFRILEELNLDTNQRFKFQKARALPFVAPIKLTYDEYLTSFKPILLKAPTDQKNFRQSIYKVNLELINVNNAQVLRDFNMGLNLFTDVELNQFYKKYNKLVIPDNLAKEGLLEESLLKNENGAIVFTTPPRINIDWTCLTSEGISQGACGASYIIAPLQTIAVTIKIYNKSSMFLSIQEVLSCGYGEAGCSGGYFQQTYDYVQKFGVGQSSFYFYDDKAKFNSEVSECNKSVIANKFYMKNKIYIESFKRIRFGDCEQLVKQLRFRAIAVAITGNGLQFYSEGTFEAISTNINHGVTLVGYQPDLGYLIKNSWGRTWGLLGYGYVSQSTGVCSFAMYPQIKSELGTPIMCSSQV